MGRAKTGKIESVSLRKVNIDDNIDTLTKSLKMYELDPHIDFSKRLEDYPGVQEFYAAAVKANEYIIPFNHVGVSTTTAFNIFDRNINSGINDLLIYGISTYNKYNERVAKKYAGLEKELLIKKDSASADCIEYLFDTFLDSTTKEALKVDSLIQYPWASVQLSKLVKQIREQYKLPVIQAPDNIPPYPDIRKRLPTEIYSDIFSIAKAANEDNPDFYADYREFCQKRNRLLCLDTLHATSRERRRWEHVKI